jgi:hypothetical protein
MRAKIAVILGLTMLLLACAKHQAARQKEVPVAQDDAHALILRVNEAEKNRDYKVFREVFDSEAIMEFNSGEVRNRFKPQGYAADLENAYSRVEEYDFSPGRVAVENIGAAAEVRQTNRITMVFMGATTVTTYANVYIVRMVNGAPKITAMTVTAFVDRRR